MGRKPPGRARRTRKCKGVRQARSKGKRPSHLGNPSNPVATAIMSESARAKPIMVMETIRSQLAALAPLKRKRTILLMEGTNALTGRPVRIYIRPDDTLVACETLGQLERPGSAVKSAAPRS